MAKVIRVILTAERRGLGDPPDDPVRLVTQLWTLDGELIFEHDSFAEGEKTKLGPGYSSMGQDGAG